jgi:anti-anti-sigma factor
MVGHDQGMQCVAVIPAPQQVVQRTLSTLERKVDDAIDSRPGIVDFACSGVQIVDSAALNWLLSVLGRMEAQNIKLRLVDPSPIMLDVLLATRLDARFTVTTSAETNGQGGANGG